MMPLHFFRKLLDCSYAYNNSFEFYTDFDPSSFMYPI